MSLTSFKQHSSEVLEKDSNIKLDESEKHIKIELWNKEDADFPIGELEGYKFENNATENIAKDNDEFEFLEQYLKNKKTIDVNMLEVKPGYRKMGVGKKLLNTLKKKAKEEGFDLLYLKARSFGNNPIPLTKLVEFYEKNGFYTIWHDKKEFLMLFETTLFEEKENGKRKNRFIQHFK